MQTCDALWKQRPSSGLKIDEPEQCKASSSIHGNSNKGVLPEEGVVSSPSHGGSYMDEGTSHIWIRLSLCIVSEDCLAYSMFPSLFTRACSMSDDTGLY